MNSVTFEEAVAGDATIIIGATHSRGTAKTHPRFLVLYKH